MIPCLGCRKAFQPQGLRAHIFKVCEKCQRRVDRVVREELRWKPDNKKLYDADEAGLLRLPGKGKKFNNLWKMVEQDDIHGSRPIRSRAGG